MENIYNYVAENVKRVQDEINEVFTQLVLLLSAKGYVSLDVEYIDGTKIESKANKYTFVWRKTTETNRSKLIEKIKNRKKLTRPSPKPTTTKRAIVIIIL